jgi:hypothetical protein
MMEKEKLEKLIEALDSAGWNIISLKKEFIKDAGQFHLLMELGPNVSKNS